MIPTDDDDRLRAESMEIERLLDEVRTLVPAPAWERIERVIARIVRLYGAGLGRALAHARACGAPEHASDAFDQRLVDDDLLSSLLVLHGLHPLPLAARVSRALARIRSELGLREDDLVLAKIEDGRVELRAGALGGGAVAERVAEATIRRVVESAAPDAASIEIHTTTQKRDPQLVQLRVRREAP